MTCCTLILVIVGLLFGTVGPYIRSYSELYNADPMLKHVRNGRMSKIANVLSKALQQKVLLCW